MGGGMMQGNMQGRMQHMQGQAVDPTKAIDPVCKMTVTKDGAKWTYDYKGTTYYFCSEGCKTKFAKEPEKFLAELAVDAKEGGMQAHAGMMGGQMQGHMQEQMQGQMQGQMPGIWG